MDHGQPQAPGDTPPLDTPCGPPNRGLAIASISLGYFSIIVFFWHPFSTVLGSVGLLLALFSMIRGVKGGLRGENLAFVGFLLCSFSLSITLTMNQFLRVLMWESR